MDGQQTFSIPLRVNFPNADEATKALEELRAVASEMRSAFEEMKKSGFGKSSLSEQEAADDLGIARTTLAEYRRDGLISYTPVGGKARYTRENIENFILNNQEICKKDRIAAKKNEQNSNLKRR